MTVRFKTLPTTLWLAGLLAALVAVSSSLSWRQLVVFLILLALLCWGRKLRPTAMDKLEPAVLLVLLSGIPLIVLWEPSVGAGATVRVWVALLLVVGTLSVCASLLQLGCDRPVAKKIDVLLALFCVVFPAAVLVLRFVVSRQFDGVPASLGAHPLAYQTLAILAVYAVLSQTIWANRTFCQQLRPVWAGVFVVLILIGAARLGSLGRNLLVLQETEFAPGPLFAKARQQADALGLGWAKQTLALKEAKHFDQQGEMSQAVAALKRAARYAKPGDPEYHRLVRQVQNPTLLALVLGAEPPAKIEFPIVAGTLDTRRGRIYLVDEQANVHAFGRKRLHRVGQVDQADRCGPVRDVLWWDGTQQLLVLFNDGSVACLAMEKRDPSAAGRGEFELNLTQWLRRPHHAPARSLAAVPGTNCVVIAYGDFEIQPLLGLLPPEIAQAKRQYRRGQDLLRDLCFLESGQGGYILDAFGGIHPFGTTPIRYADLKSHARQKHHYWPGQDIARGIGCSRDGRGVIVFDSFAAVHGLEKAQSDGKVHYFGSIQAQSEGPDVVGVVSAYHSYYLIHRTGRIDSKVGGEELFALFRPVQTNALAGLPALLVASFLSWVLLSATRPIRRSA